MEGRGGEGGGSEFVPPQYMQTFVKFRVFIKERYLCSFTKYHLLANGSSLTGLYQNLKKSTIFEGSIQCSSLCFTSGKRVLLVIMVNFGLKVKVANI